MTHSDYWKHYWDSHTENIENLEPHRQVQRVLNKQVIQDKLFIKMVDDLVDKLSIDKNDKVLDLCGGNGMIAAAIAPKCSSVTVVDFSESLIKQISKYPFSNISTIISDITNVDFEDSAYNKILWYAGIQYLSQSQVIKLLPRIHNWLVESGLLFIGDIPDFSKIWKFYNTAEREEAYFLSQSVGKPIIGNWYERVWLEKLAQFAGFKDVRSYDQPADFIYSYFRFDLLLKK